MYPTQWGLTKSPFPSGIDLQLFYEGFNQREALARLRYLTSHPSRCGLMLGNAGFGKSHLLQLFAKECRLHGKAVALVDLLGLSTHEFLWQLGIQLEAAVHIENQPPRLFRQLTDRFQELSFERQRIVLLLDNVDQVGPDLRTLLLRLAQNETTRATGLTLVFSANASHSAQLGERLLDLVDLRIDLEAWDELDTIGYLQLALVAVGLEQPLFNDEGISELHRISGGVPRKINRLAEHSLLVSSQMIDSQAPDSSMPDSRLMIGAKAVQAADELLSLPCTG
ncbi:MAG: hypothetical protein CMJ72_10225 [Planctomycetaceae bacterium]|nr:hypothetical protein [Planctomycetaceae bacterium]